MFVEQQQELPKKKPASRLTSNSIEIGDNGSTNTLVSTGVSGGGDYQSSEVVIPLKARKLQS
jgi:hypothetical protein